MMLHFAENLLCDRAQISTPAIFSPSPGIGTGGLDLIAMESTDRIAEPIPISLDLVQISQHQLTQPQPTNMTYDQILAVLNQFAPPVGPPGDRQLGQMVQGMGNPLVEPPAALPWGFSEILPSSREGEQPPLQLDYDSGNQQVSSNHGGFRIEYHNACAPGLDYALIANTPLSDRSEMSFESGENPNSPLQIENSRRVRSEGGGSSQMAPKRQRALEMEGENPPCSVPPPPQAAVSGLMGPPPPRDVGLVRQNSFSDRMAMSGANSDAPPPSYHSSAESSAALAPQVRDTQSALAPQVARNWIYTQSLSEGQEQLKAVVDQLLTQSADQRVLNQELLHRMTERANIMGTQNIDLEQYAQRLMETCMQCEQGLVATQLQLSQELQHRLTESFNAFSASLHERDRHLKSEVSQLVEPLAREMAQVRAENRMLNECMVNLGTQVSHLGGMSKDHCPAKI